MRSKAAAVAILLLALLPALAGFLRAAAADFAVLRTDLRYLLPGASAGGPDPAAAAFTERLAGELVFVFEAGPGAGSPVPAETDAALRAAARDLTAYLGGVKGIAVRDPAAFAETGRFLFERRYALGAGRFLTDGRPDPAKLREAVGAILFSPFGGATAAEIAHDPFFIMRDWLARQNISRYGRDPDGLAYVTEGGRRAYIVSARADAAALGGADRKEISRRAAELRAELREKGARLSYTGALFFAEEAREASERDIALISAVSGIALVFLLVWFFRSAGPLLWGSLVLAGGMAAAAGAVVAATGGIHVVTLAIGSSLAGVSFDYILHVMGRCAGADPGDVPRIRAELRNPLLLSLATSVTAYGAAGLTGLPALAELALFAAAGLVAVFLMSYFLLPRVRTGRAPGAAVPFGKIAARAERLARAETTVWGALLFLGAAGAAAFALLARAPDDDVARLRPAGSVLAAADRRVSRLTGGPAAAKWFIVSGAGPDGALENCAAFAAGLSPAQAKGFDAPCLRIPARGEQRASVAAYRELFPELAKIYAELGVTLTEEGIGLARAETFDPRLVPGAGDFMTGAGELLARADASDAALLKKIAADRNFRPLDRRGEWSRAFAACREKLELTLIAALLAAAAAGFLLRGRRVFREFILPAGGGLCAGLAACVLAAGARDVFTAAGLFIVAGLGADYCIFIAGARPGNRAEVLKILLLAWVSTETAAGLLSLSGLPAARAVGAAVFWGLLAIPPLALLFARPDPGEEAQGSGEREGRAAAGDASVF